MQTSMKEYIVSVKWTIPKDHPQFSLLYLSERQLSDRGTLFDAGHEKAVLIPLEKKNINAH